MKWAQNKSKLSRALSMAKGQSEEDVKAMYVSIGGLLIEQEPELPEEIKEIELSEDKEIVMKPIKTIKKSVKKVVKKSSSKKC